MKSLSPRKLTLVSAMALSLGLGYAVAQQANPDISPEVSEQAQDAANNNKPLAVPEDAQPDTGVMPQSFANLVEQVAPAVVNITTTAVIERPTRGPGGPAFPEGSPFDELFREFGFPGMPGPEGGPRSQRSNALGSGFVISADGYIVTNNHVIDGADEIEIEFYSGKTLPAEVVGTDPKTDIALLKVDSEDAIPFVKFGDSDKARVGDWVLALGNPLGQGFSASSGIVSARNRELSGTYDDYLQTDAAINRGNSGGPLFNLKGEVVGVNTAILSPNGGSIGIGFSMTSNVVSNVIDQLRDYGETRRGWLGVSIQNITPDMAEALGLETEGGAMVTDVPEGPARAAGIKAGDVITTFAGNKVEDTRELVRHVADAPIGEAVEVVVQRDGEEETLEVTLGRREVAEGTVDADSGEPGDQDAGDVLGLELMPLTSEVAAELDMPPGATGLVIQAVDPNSAASEKGLAAGDVITEVGQKPVATVADLNARIDAAREAGRKSVLVLISRGGQSRFLALPIGE